MLETFQEFVSAIIKERNKRNIQYGQTSVCGQLTSFTESNANDSGCIVNGPDITSAYIYAEVFG